MARRHAFSGLFLIGQRVRVGVRVRFGSWGLKAFPGQRKRYGGLAASYRGLSRHLLAFIFVLGPLFIFFMPLLLFFRAVQRLAAQDGDDEQSYSSYIFFSVVRGVRLQFRWLWPSTVGWGEGGSKSWSINDLERR